MKKILIVLLLTATLSIAQFKSYDIVDPIASHELTVEQKEVAINHFAEGLSPTNVQNLYYPIGVTVQLVEVVYNGIRNIEAYAFQCMDGTVVESTDGNGVITYYDKVSTQVLLVSMVNVKYPNQTDITVYLLDKMIDYSKKDGSGNWTFYLSQF